MGNDAVHKKYGSMLPSKKCCQPSWHNPLELVALPGDKLKKMTFWCRTRLHTLPLLTSAEWKQVLILYVLHLEENDGWNAARRCNKGESIHHGCPWADRKPCLESTISRSQQKRSWFIHSPDKAVTFHPASSAAPSYYLTSSWHQHSSGRGRDLMWPACRSVSLTLLLCLCCRRRAVWSLRNKVHALD